MTSVQRKSSDSSNDDTPEKEISISQNKKNISYVEIYHLIKKMNLDYNKNQTMEIIQELGIDKRKSIHIENLIETSKNRRSVSKYSDFYDNILNLFITPSERIIKILEDCREKLKEFKQDKLVSDLDWVMKKIHNDDIYNLNLDLINERNIFNDMDTLDNRKNSVEMESLMKFYAEFSSDTFTKNKKEDLKTVKDLSDKRNKYENKYRRSISMINANRKSLLNNEQHLFIHNFSLSPEISHKERPAKLNNGGVSKYSSENSFTLKQFNVIKEEEDEKETQNFNICSNFKMDILLNSDREDGSNPILNNNCNSNGSYKSVVNNNLNEDKHFLLNKSEEISINDDINENRLLLQNNLNTPNKLLPLHQSDYQLTLSAGLKINLIDEISFNIFEYSNTVGRDNLFVNISEYIFEKYALFSVVNPQRFQTFLNKIRVGYDYLLPYHNDFHAMDVLQTSNVFTIYSDLKTNLQLTSLDLAAFFTACIIHDFKHPGLNNSYHINKRSLIATKYNDVSVLENYHVSSAFKVLAHPNSNIFCDLSVEEYRVARKRIVECVLATDMAKHAKAQTSLRIKIDGFKNKCAQDQILTSFIQNASEETKFDRQQQILCYLIHMADISNPGKQFNVSKIWSDLVMEEFFAQGEIERTENLPISFLCDRNNTNVPKSQIMFISNIVLPCFNILVQLSPKCNVFILNMYDNIKKWEKEDEKNNCDRNCK